MKSTATLSLLLGILAATVLAQDAPVTVETVTLAPLTSDDGSAVADPFPIPVEMAKRDVANQSLAQRSTSNLTKRHYGTFTCSTSLNNYCKQFLSQDGVGGLVGCEGGTCYVGCGVSGYTRTNDASDICINTSTDVANCGTDNFVCPAVANGTPVCNNGQCSATCTAPYTLVGGKCVNTASDATNCGPSGLNCASRAGTGYVAGSARCSGGTCSVSCANGYTSANGVCTSAYLADTSNCGAAGNNCATNAGTGYLAGSAKCTAGSCSVSCQTGYTSTDGKTCTLACKDGSVLVNGVCGRVTACTTNADCITGTGNANSYCYLSSSGNACFSGSTNSAGLPAGSACGYGSNLSGDDNGCASGLVCLNHVCQATTSNDPNNCGKAGVVCPTPTNGARFCQAGSCGITCNKDYTAQGTTCVNTNTDASNCGALGTKCAATGTGATSSTCVLGKCRVTCGNGYTLSVDGTTCNSVCADGSYLNGVTCTRYGCSTNAQCQTQTGRTDSACFSGLCYTSSSNTIGLPAGSPCGLSPISGGDDNQCAAGLVCVYYTCYNANSPAACGASRTVCPTPANSVATCNLGTCGFTCKTGYMANTAGTGCVLNPSAKTTKKKRGQAGPELCPKGESACPIVGSASFGAFVNSSDRVKDFAHSLGGYECIDTRSEVQSCGGCASLGTGFDCTRLAHSSEVGCSNGKCVLLSCKKGYAPALDGEKCMKVEETQKQRSAHLRQRAMRRKDISH